MQNSTLFMENSSDSFNKIILTGANGQLGTDIRLICEAKNDERFIFTDIAELDITNHESVRKFFSLHNPDLVVNCAAYTAVDKAEEEVEKAFLLNSEAPKILATEAKKTGAKLIHVSTDYVFNGKNYIPYNEETQTSPNSAYGKSKLEGEKNALETGISMVIRTSWLYSPHGNNFMKTIIKKGKELPQLNVVFDQIGTPTLAKDLATAIIEIINQGKGSFQNEVFHFSNEGVCSWYDFAKEIVQQLAINCKINAILSNEYPTAAVRPPYSVLDKTKVKKAYGIEIPHWRESLCSCIKEINL